MKRLSLWRNSRGEYYVVVQAILMLLILIGPRFGAPAWGPPWSAVSLLVGGLIGATGLLLFIAGTLGLGRKNLSPFPHPKAGATLVTSGPYAIVRHPPRLAGHWRGAVP